MNPINALLGFFVTLVLCCFGALFYTRIMAIRALMRRARSDARAQWLADRLGR